MLILFIACLADSEPGFATGGDMAALNDDLVGDSDSGLGLQYKEVGLLTCVDHGVDDPSGGRGIMVFQVGCGLLDYNREGSNETAPYHCVMEWDGTWMTCGNALTKARGTYVSQEQALAEVGAIYGEDLSSVVSLRRDYPEECIHPDHQWPGDYETYTGDPYEVSGAGIRFLDINAMHSACWSGGSMWGGSYPAGGVFMPMVDTPECRAALDEVEGSDGNPAFVDTGIDSGVRGLFWASPVQYSMLWIHQDLTRSDLVGH